MKAENRGKVALSHVIVATAESLIPMAETNADTTTFAAKPPAAPRELVPVSILVIGSAGDFRLRPATFASGGHKLPGCLGLFSQETFLLQSAQRLSVIGRGSRSCD